MYNDFLKAAIAITIRQKNIFLSAFGKKSNIKIKKNNFRDLVTKTDLKIELNLRKALLSKYPSHNFLGEETYDLHNKNVSDFCWVADPIDGTTNFIQKIPYCCVSLALLHKNKPVVGVVYNPITGELFYAAEKSGSFLNSKKIRTNSTKNFSSAFGGASWVKDAGHGVKLMSFLLPNSLKVRATGSAALNICEVANGRYDYFVGSGGINLWDVAASIVIIKEAGGAAKDKLNREILLNHNIDSIIAANPVLQKIISNLMMKNKI